MPLARAGRSSASEEIESTCYFACPEIINAVEFSPYQNTSKLIAYGGESRICIGSCSFDDENLQEFQFEHQVDISHGARVDAIAWSPQSSLDQYPGLLRFCTAGGDKKLRCFSVDLKDNSTVQMLDGHESYINDCVFNPLQGDAIASVSDDHTCRIWDVESGQETALFHLTSPGVSVKWIPNEPNKLLVAQKNGTIRIYDIVSQRPFMSFSTLTSPLKCVDWSTANPIRVGGVVSNEWEIWDISQYSSPQASKEAHIEGACSFRWCKLTDGIFATSGRPGNQVKVFQVGHHKNPVTANLKVGGGLSWHSRLPICAAGGDHAVHLWRLEL